jgi:tRNA-Thr(GGU) m(6)t(6)A37 methyltransferase TsaA
LSRFPFNFLFQKVDQNFAIDNDWSKTNANEKMHIFLNFLPKTVEKFVTLCYNSKYFCCLGGNMENLKVIAHIKTDFPTKFGIPRQSGLIEELQGEIIMENPYRNPDAFRGLLDFSHIWLLWSFSEVKKTEWSPTVRPPRLGGNTRMGVFATRSPYRPNPIGLSLVRLVDIRNDPQLGPVLVVAGADLMDGTPIFDIKPYLPLADCRPQAVGGFAEHTKGARLQVVLPDKWASLLPADRTAGLVAALADDPRPAYQNDPEREYGFPFANFEVKFKVDGDTLTVTDIKSLTKRCQN